MRNLIQLSLVLASLVFAGGASADRDETGLSLDRDPAERERGAVALSVGKLQDAALTVVANDPSIRILAVEIVDRQGYEVSVAVSNRDYQVLELGPQPDAIRVEVAYDNDRPSRGDEIVLTADAEEQGAEPDEPFFDWYHCDKWSLD